MDGVHGNRDQANPAPSTGQEEIYRHYLYNIIQDSNTDVALCIDGWKFK